MTPSRPSGWGKHREAPQQIQGVELMADTGKTGGMSQGQNAGRTGGGQQGASSMTEQAKNVGSTASSTAQDLTRRATEVGSDLAERAGEAVGSLGTQMQNLAGTIREKVPQEGWMGTAAESVAGTLETGGRYLKDQDLSDIADDVTGLIRRYPVQAVLVGIGLGFLVARATRS
jgi:hypothetical protein